MEPSPELSPVLRSVLSTQAERLAAASEARAENTLLAYRIAWSGFLRWCAERHLAFLPADPETVAQYVADLIAVKGRRPATAELHVAAIAHVHRQAELCCPIDKRIRQILAGARRLAPLPEGKAALSADNLRQIVCRLGTSTLHLRNRAILLLGFATALRRENLATLMLEDLQFRPQGVIVQVSKEKTNQNGPPRWIGVYTASGDLCPVAAVRTWIDVRGTSPGPLFCHVRRHIQPSRGLAPEQFARIVQHLARLAGFDPHRYGAHSLRAGFVTAAAQAGASPLLIMQTTGHRTLAMVQRYFRPASVFAVNPLAGVL